MDSTIVTIEISMYPLASNYTEHIISFIKRLKGHQSLRVKTNSMSTFVQGEFYEVWGILGAELALSFESGVPMSSVFKLIPRQLPLESTWLEF